jgi:hypothetical protein
VTDLDVLQAVALASLLAWASGIRLYLAIFVIGLCGYLGYLELPAGLKILQHPWVLIAAGWMVLVEFITDKVPALDSLWDTFHTFIRIPAGALLAAGATSDTVTALTVAAALLGGTLTAGTHFAKAGGRALINTSPEPVTNWSASFTEDALVLGGIWLALHHPVVFLAALVLFIGALLWLLPKLVRGIRAVLRRVRGRTVGPSAG